MKTLVIKKENSSEGLSIDFTKEEIDNLAH